MKTVKSKIEVSGNGLMSAVPCIIELCPSNEKGIRFHIGDCVIKACQSNVVSTEHCVVLGNPNDLTSPKVALVEHFMASCAIVGIDSLDVYFKNPNFEVAKLMHNAFEIPILDGSAKVWVEKFNEAGFMGVEEEVQKLMQPVNFIKGKSVITLLPIESDTEITYVVNYNHPDLKNRFATLKQDENMDEITSARTFGYLKDLDMLQRAGYSKGVTIENTVGLIDDGTYTAPLRSEFEPIKHKILDIIGDLYLTGFNPLKLNAAIIVKEAGHALHVECAKILYEKMGENNESNALVF